MATDGIALLVGLGNIGKQYEQTRHNAGFVFLDLLAGAERLSFQNQAKWYGKSSTWRHGSHTTYLLKPGTLMNCSGRSVAAAANYLHISSEQILVVHDELDFPSGQIRLKFGGGHGGHNGLRDIIKALNSSDFYRLRIGIDKPPHREQMVNHVLSRAGKGEQQALLDNMQACQVLMPQLMQGSIAQVMQTINSR